MYIALKSFKVKQADGSYRMTKPGEPLPEAAEWRNAKAYVERGWIAREGETGKRRHYTDRGAVAAKVETSRPAPAPAPTPEPEPAPLPTAPEPETETDAPPAEPDEQPLTKKVLKAMATERLQEMASEMGLDPDQSKSKLISAIIKAAE